MGKEDSGVLGSWSTTDDASTILPELRAMRYAQVYIHNRLPNQRRHHDRRSPIEQLTGSSPPALTRLRARRCPAVIPDHRRLLNKRYHPGRPGRFVGYSDDSYAYRIALNSGKIVEASSVVLHEPRTPLSSLPTVSSSSSTPLNFLRKKPAHSYKCHISIQIYIYIRFLLKSLYFCKF